MHLVDHLAGPEPTLSFEIFPPRNPGAEKRLDHTLEKLAEFRPDFVSVTYGAAGSTRQFTTDCVDRLVEDARFDPIPHLTCLGVKFQEVVHSIASGQGGVGTTNPTTPDNRMNIHSNARLTPIRREEMARSVIDGSCTAKEAAASFAVSEKTVRKWVSRYRQGDAMFDRSSRPHTSPAQLSRAKRHGIIRRRCRRWPLAQIAALFCVSIASVSRVLARAGISRLRDLEPPEAPRRYQRQHPGELLHMDIKKLGRIEAEGHRIHGDRSRRRKGAGWEYVHVVIDDASRIAYAEVLEDERKDTAASFLVRALAYYRGLDITCQRLMTDNGSCYRSKLFDKVCSAAGLRHLFTRPYTPKTNGKAERFIQTMTRSWAHGRSYDHSTLRKAALPDWLHRYNWHRPHHGLNLNTPISILRLSRNNLLLHHT